MPHQVVGHGVDRLGLLAGQIEILDVVGHVAEPVAGREIVVEVLAASAHAADVKRQLRFRPRQPILDVVADGQGRADHDVERPEFRVALGHSGAQ